MLAQGRGKWAVSQKRIMIPCPPTLPLSQHFAPSEKEVLILAQGRGSQAVFQKRIIIQDHYAPQVHTQRPRIYGENLSRLEGSQLYISGKLPTYPSHKSTFCPNCEVSVNDGLREGQVGSLPETYNCDPSNRDKFSPYKRGFRV